MKKFFLLSLLAGASLAASAEVIVSPTGLMNEVGFQAESLSPDASSFACGSNQLNSQPAIWNVATGEVIEFFHLDTAYSYDPIFGTKMDWVYNYDWDFESPTFGQVIDSVWSEVDDYDNVIGIDTVPMEDPYTGTLHAINNAGLAVGTFGSSMYGQQYPVKVMPGDTAVTYLYANREMEDGGDAYAVNADGSLIIGFYTMGMGAQACVWVNGGLYAEDRIDLPTPNEEDFGSPIDYVSARWMSEDGSVILGYAQDFINGHWVMVHWTKEADGSYAAHAEYAKQYFTPTIFDEATSSEAYMKPNCPYSNFEPQGISANGEWVSLSVTPLIDLSDWSTPEIKKAARLNLTTGVLEVLNFGSYDAPIFYGIANNGTAAGSTEVGGWGPLSMLGESISSVRVGFVWPTNCSDIFSLQNIFPEEEYFAFDETTGEATVSGISADASKIYGFTNKTDGISDWMVSSFIAELPELPNGFQRVDAAEKAAKVLMNGKVVILRNGARYNMIGAKL